MSALIIYHGGCADGTAAAHILAARMRADDSTCTLYGSFNRDFSKNKGIPSIAGSRIYILDYCFDLVSLNYIASVAESLHILDHHETNLRLLCADTSRDKLVLSYNGCNDTVKLDAHNKCRIFIYIDTSLCATEIVSIVYRIKPWYVQHIRDRDLHLWDAVPPVPYDRRSKAFGEALFELGICEETFAKLDKYDESQKDKMYSRGQSLLEHNERFATTICRKAERGTFHGHPTGIVTAVTLQTELGDTMLTDNTISVCAIIRYSLKEGLWYVSLRSRRDGPNVALIAEKYGGGGHKNAAGFDYRGDIGKLFVI